MLEYIDTRTNSRVYAKRKPIELVVNLRKIKECIKDKKYEDAISIYYKYLGEELFGELTKEIIYLKRLANKNLAPRDIMYFFGQSARSELIKNNIEEFIQCMESVIQELKEINRETPIAIIIKNVPTMEELLDERNHKWNNAIYLWNGEIQKNSQEVTLRNFSTVYDFCPEGRLFERYPDPIYYCDIYEPVERPELLGLWTTYSKDSIQEIVYDKGCILLGIEIYQPKSWRYYRGKFKKVPDFESIKDIDSLVKYDYAVDDIAFTGASHKIRNQLFYEIDISHSSIYKEKIGNPLKDLLDEIFRESENKLRENHNLPKIGEGWISETQLFYLVKEKFDGAIQHHSPYWLYPQHLDIFIPSRNIAIEYQGRQHFEPIDFFGGVEAFQENLKRDKRKKKKCQDNKVKLIEWHYETPINRENLDIILRRNEEG